MSFDLVCEPFYRPFAVERESIEKAFQEKLNAQEVNMLALHLLLCTVGL